MVARTHAVPLDDAALAWLALALVPELLPRRAFALVARFGTPRAVLEAPAGALAAAGVPPAVVASVGAAARRARAETLKLAAAGATLVAWSDDAYPPALRHIAQPPLVLAVRGGLGGADEPAIAIVGARRASEYGRRMAEALARRFAQAGVTVVSGLAAGIDAAAHRGALAAAGRTVAVLGTGIDCVYPRWHRALAGAIAGQGALEELWPELLPRLAAQQAAAAEAALSAPERQILAAIGPEGRHVDDVIRQAAVSPGAALETLLALELRGLVCQLPGKRFCRRAA